MKCEHLPFIHLEQTLNLSYDKIVIVESCQELKQHQCAKRSSETLKPIFRIFLLLPFYFTVSVSLHFLLENAYLIKK
jgi:hypothetical protein